MTCWLKYGSDSKTFLKDPQNCPFFNSNTLCSNVEPEINQNQAAADVKIEIDNDDINIDEIINSFASNPNEYDLVQWSEQEVSILIITVVQFLSTIFFICHYRIRKIQKTMTTLKNQIRLKQEWALEEVHGSLESDLKSIRKHRKNGQKLNLKLQIQKMRSE